MEQTLESVRKSHPQLFGAGRPLGSFDNCLATLKGRLVVVHHLATADLKSKGNGDIFNRHRPVTFIASFYGGGGMDVGGIEAAKHVELQNTNMRNAVCETRNCPDKVVRGWRAGNHSGYARNHVEYFNFDINACLLDPYGGPLHGVRDLFDFAEACFMRFSLRQWILFHCALPCRWLRPGSCSSRWPALTISYVCSNVGTTQRRRVGS